MEDNARKLGILNNNSCSHAGDRRVVSVWSSQIFCPMRLPSHVTDHSASLGSNLRLHASGWEVTERARQWNHLDLVAFLCLL